MAAGDVTVTTAAIAETKIKRIVRTDGAHDPETSYRINGTVLTLDTSCGHQCSVSYEIQAPAGVGVRGKVGSGDLMLSDISTADIQLGSGDATIERVSGAATLKNGSGQLIATDLRAEATLVTGSGSIEARGLSGGKAVRAQSGSGEIIVELTQAAPVTARTGSGEIELTVPDGAYQLKTHTGSGEAAVIGLVNDPTAKNLIDVQTGSGDATVTAVPGA